MTFSVPKVRKNYSVIGQGITGSPPPGPILDDEIPCGTVISSVHQIDMFFLQDVSGSYPASVSIPFIRKMLPCIQTAFSNPNNRIGLGYFSDYPIGPYGDTGDTPFGIAAPLSTYTVGEINSFTLPELDGGDTPEAQLDALVGAATNLSVGWSIGPVKKFVIVSTDTTPHDSSLEPGAPHTTKAAAISALQSARLYPIYVSTGTGYNLGFGKSGTGTTAQLERQILTAMADALFDWPYLVD